jgi:hypothetical protein
MERRVDGCHRFHHHRHLPFVMPDIHEVPEGFSPTVLWRLPSFPQSLQEAAETSPQGVSVCPWWGDVKAYHLIKISQKFERIGLPEPQLNRLGWTKLEIVGRHITKPSASKLMALAEKYKAKDLEAAILSDGLSKRTQSVLLFFTSNQHRKFTSAIVRFGATRSGRGFIGKEEALIAIIQKASTPPASLSKGV